MFLLSIFAVCRSGSSSFTNMKTNKPTCTHGCGHTMTQTGCWCVMKLWSQQQAAASETQQWQMSRVEQTQTLLFWRLTSSGSSATHLEPQLQNQNILNSSRTRWGPSFSLTCSCIHCDARPQAVKVAMKLICLRLFHLGLFSSDLGSA